MVGELLNYHSSPDVYSFKCLVTIEVRLERRRPALVSTLLQGWNMGLPSLTHYMITSELLP